MSEKKRFGVKFWIKASTQTLPGGLLCSVIYPSVKPSNSRFEKSFCTTMKIRYDSRVMTMPKEKARYAVHATTMSFANCSGIARVYKLRHTAQDVSRKHLNQSLL